MIPTNSINVDNTIVCIDGIPLLVTVIVVRMVYGMVRVTVVVVVIVVPVATVTVTVKGFTTVVVTV